MSTRRLGVLGALLALVLAACSAGDGSGGQVEGTQWVLDAYLSDGSLAIVPPSIYADATFENNRVTGFSGCNTYHAVYRASGRSLIVSQGAATTLMACPDAEMAFEQTYLALLDSSRFYGVVASRLTIYDGNRTPVLRFAAAPRNPLLGRWTVEGYGVPPSTVIGVLDDAPIDVAFGIASVGGFAGCNSFSGVYGTNGDILAISPLATTRLTCAQPVMDQEAAFLQALQGASIVVSRGPRLNLTDRQGHLVVALARPGTAPEASASPSPGESASPTPTASATPSPTASPTPKPTASPTPKPTASPTPAPTPSPSPGPTASPTAAPTASAKPTAAPTPTPIPTFPPTASCKLAPAGGGVVATIVYPGTWYTLKEPPDLACRYFDAEPITVPTDPSTIKTAVRADVLATSFQDAVAAATDPATWTVASKSEFNVRGAAVTCIAAIATDAATTVAPGTGQYSCLANVQTAGTVAIWTSGTPGDPTLAANAAVVELMTLQSTFTPPG